MGWYRKVLSTNDQYINRVFDVFDDNGDGHIDAKELALILFPENYDADSVANIDVDTETYDDEDEDEDNKNLLATVKKMINEVDVNGDGKIDFDEFKKAMNEDLEAGKLISKDDDGWKTDN